MVIGIPRRGTMAAFGKFKISWNRVGVVLAVVVLLWTMPNSIESRTPLRGEPATHKVIVSPHLGEITSDSRYAGETVKFKIYYHQEGPKNTDITIMDPLDPNLSNPNVFNNGAYDAAAHKIT
jgi:hypothetical protein